MKHLNIDIETRSRLDLSEVGVYKYAENCEILIFGYAVDFGEVKVLDLLHGDKIPDYIIKAIYSADVKKHAYNAQFERVVLGYYLQGRPLDPLSWYCTMVHSFYCGLPASLDALTRFMFKDHQEYVKDKRGKALIRKFSSVRYVEPELDGLENEDDWISYLAYNKQDVVAEMEAYRRIETFCPFPEKEHVNYVNDQLINDYGVRIDTQFAKKAKELGEELKYKRLKEWKAITGLETPNQYGALKDWLTQHTGVECESVAKDKIDDFVNSVPIMPKEVMRAIEIKRELAKSSLAKYTKAIACTCNDGRAHGLFQFYGARTGRFAGRSIQLQNLPRNSIEPIELWKEGVRYATLECLESITANVPSLLSQLIRTMFIPAKGLKFFVSDYHAIEAVLSAWLAGEEWRLDVFRGDGKIYEASAAEMFGVPINTITKPDGSHGENYPLRAKGKIAELALGYGGGVGALAKMGGEKMGLSIEEMTNIVQLWRSRSPNIVKMWTLLDRGLRSVISGISKCYYINKDTNREISIYKRYNFLVVKLPSQRELYYCNPSLASAITPWGDITNKIVFYGQDQTTRKFKRIETRGSKIFENIIQAIARDILVNAINNLIKAGHIPVLHVHDEICVEAQENSFSVEEMNKLMCSFPEWAQDLPLESAGFKTDFYRKD